MKIKCPKKCKTCCYFGIVYDKTKSYPRWCSAFGKLCAEAFGRCSSIENRYEKRSWWNPMPNLKGKGKKLNTKT